MFGFSTCLIAHDFVPTGGRVFGTTGFALGGGTGQNFLVHRGLMSLPRSQTGWILPSTQRQTQAASASNANRTKNPKKTIEIARMIETYGAPSLGAMAPREILLATQAGAIRPAVWIFGLDARVFCGFVGAFTVRSIWMNNA